MAAEVVIYTPMEIEQMAEDTLRRRGDIPFAAPIKMERLLVNTPNVMIEYEYGLRIDYRVEGYVCKQFMSKTLTVWIDQRIMEGPLPEYNRVLGEEFAHISIHPSIFFDINSVDDFIEMQMHPHWNRFESDARRFSAAIRMPPYLVKMEAALAYEYVVNDVGFESAAIIENRMTMRLAEVFQVTPVEMKRRLANPPCNLREQILNSIQSRSERLLPLGWTVNAVPPSHQRTFGERSPRPR